jgi:ABC-2 type transport system permease protein
MTGFAAALAAEMRKTTASRVVRSATILLVGGVAVLAGSLTLAAAGGNERVLDQLGPLAELTGWDRYLGVVAQITAAATLLGFGVVLSWIVGREFADGTVSGLFALPVSRSAIALAKLSVFLAWGAAVGVLLAVVLVGAGLAIGLGPLDGAAWKGIGRQLALTVLTAGLAVPAAWAATLGRGLLPGIAVSVGTIVIAQVAVVAGTGAWLPVAAPALWVLDPETVTGVQLALALTVPAAFGLATLMAWRRLQLNR